MLLGRFANLPDDLGLSCIELPNRGEESGTFGSDVDSCSCAHYPRADYRSVVNDLDQDWADYFIVDVSEILVKAAGLLAESHALRGADAIHLASAVALSKQARV